MDISSMVKHSSNRSVNGSCFCEVVGSTVKLPVNLLTSESTKSPLYLVISYGWTSGDVIYIFSVYWYSIGERFANTNPVTRTAPTDKIPQATFLVVTPFDDMKYTSTKRSKETEMENSDWTRKPKSNLSPG